ncbi:MAG: FAD-dependent oxidoreductase [Rhodospirillaceae bacterium]|nr:FAD-dependent oxidoreductase [Rhodospirillaceae bacterium]
MTDRVDTVVIGAGVVGLAVARKLAQAGREVIILEAADLIGSETSSRNSEVIHAGIYYPTGSLKAQLCVAGKHALYDYCTEREIPHRRCGKLIVATDESQIATLEALKAKAAENDVPDLEMISGAEAQAMEPAVRCVAALISPSTGIIDSHALMLNYQGDAENAGAVTVFNSRVVRGKIDDTGITLAVADEDAGEYEVEAEIVVNSAGLWAQAVAGSIEGMPAESVPPTYYAKGNYFTLAGGRPFGRLIYPVPEPGGLGVHVTIDLGGQVRFGPDVEWIDSIDYSLDASRGDKFYEAVRRYFPDLKDGALQPGYTGIRPKVTPKGTQAADFMIQGPATHQVPGLVNLFGIESPGLTASLAIADMVAEKLGLA